MKSILSFQQVVPSSLFQMSPHQEHLLKAFPSLKDLVSLAGNTEVLVEKSSA